MDLRIKFKPIKYTIKAQNLNFAYYQILEKLPARACFTYGSRGNGSQFAARYDARYDKLYIYNDY